MACGVIRETLVLRFVVRLLMKSGPSASAKILIDASAFPEFVGDRNFKCPPPPSLEYYLPVHVNEAQAKPRSTAQRTSK